MSCTNFFAVLCSGSGHHYVPLSPYPAIFQYASFYFYYFPPGGRTCRRSYPVGYIGHYTREQFDFTTVKLIGMFFNSSKFNCSIVCRSNCFLKGRKKCWFASRAPASSYHRIDPDSMKLLIALANPCVS